MRRSSSNTLEAEGFKGRTDFHISAEPYEDFSDVFLQINDIIHICAKRDTYKISLRGYFGFN